MTYPQPPWTLHGAGFQTLHLLDIERVQPLLPSQLDVISVFPGKTLGGLYLATYQTGSALIYSELIVVSALARYKNKIGLWISHIYVDNADSMAGGREIWGLPKELAEFTWQMGDRPSVRVTQGDTLLCSLTSQWMLPGLPQSFTGAIFSQLDTSLLIFDGEASLTWQIAGTNLHIPQESPFAWLNLQQPWLSVYCNPLHLIAHVPFLLEEKSPIAV